MKILEHVKKDLFKSGTEKRPQFTLKPNVVKEIESLDAVDIPRYLIHRYRYEIYPQIKIFDDKNIHLYKFLIFYPCAYDKTYQMFLLYHC